MTHLFLENVAHILVPWYIRNKYTLCSSKQLQGILITSAKKVALTHVCLFVCLLATLLELHENFAKKMHLWTRNFLLNFGSLDPELGIFEGFFKIVHFSNTGHWHLYALCKCSCKLTYWTDSTDSQTI